MLETTSQQNFIDERILPAEELREEEQWLQAASEARKEIQGNNSATRIDPGNYIADKDCYTTTSPSAVASPNIALLSTSNSFAKELRESEGSSVARTDHGNFAYDKIRPIDIGDKQRNSDKNTSTEMTFKFLSVADCIKDFANTMKCRKKAKRAVRR